MIPHNYNRDATYQYGMQYAYNYNTAQYNTIPNGDCANFVSQCLRAGGLQFKTTGGYTWYYLNGSSPKPWRGVDSMLTFFRKPFGNTRFTLAFPATSSTLKRGDLVFTVSDGTPGSVNRDPSHVCIISRDVSSAGGVYVFAHTDDKRDEPRTLGDRVSLWVKLSNEYYDEYDDIAFVDDQDKSTASAYFNADVVSKYENPLVVRPEVRNIQIRLNYLGFNAGTPDGKYGNNTRLAVEAFQRSFRRYSLTVDGKAGRQTKEALSYPAGS